MPDILDRPPVTIEVEPAPPVGPAVPPVPKPSPQGTFLVKAIADIRGLTTTSFGNVLVSVLGELNNSNSRNNDALAKIILRDADLAATLTGVANSVAYMGYGQVNSVEDAVRKLGRNTVRCYALRQAAVWLGSEATAQADILLAHTLVAAEIAYELGSLRGPSFANEAQLAGLVHDFGKLILLKCEPSITMSMAQYCRAEGLTTIEAERRYISSEFGETADHASLGSFFLKLSNMPVGIVDAVKEHHESWGQHIKGWNSWTLSGVVILANLLARRAGYGDGISESTADQHPDPLLLLRLNRNPVELDRLVGRAVVRAEEVIAQILHRRDSESLREQQEVLRSSFRSELQLVAANDQQDRELEYCLLLDQLLAHPVTSVEDLERIWGDRDRDGLDARLQQIVAHGYVTCDNVEGVTYRPTGRLGRTSLPEVLSSVGTEPPTATAGGRAADILASLLIADPDREPLEFSATAPLTDARWSPDGRQVALRVGHRAVFVLDANNLTTVGRHGSVARDATGDIITALDWVAGGRQLCLARENGHVEIFAAADLNAVVARAQYPEANICALACHPRKTTVVALGAAGGQVLLWTRASDRGRAEAKTLGYHGALVRCLAWSPDGALLASGAADGIVRIWDIAADEVVEVMAGHTDAVNDLVWSPDGLQLASAGEDGALLIWNLPARKYVMQSQGHGTPLVRISRSPDGRIVAGLGRDGQFLLWRTDTRQVSRAMPIPLESDGYRAWGGCLGFHPTQPVLLVPGVGGRRARIQYYSAADTLAVLAAGRTVPVEAMDEWQSGSLPKREPVRVVHISDLHFGGRENAVLPARRLDLDVRKLFPSRPDVVIVSGDLVNSAAEDEYAICWDFLAKLAAVWKIPRESFVLVPGNHDVDWSMTPCLVDEAAHIEAESTGCCPRRKECHAQNMDCTRYRNRFMNFSKHLFGRFQGREFPLTYGDQVVTYDMPDLALRFVGYNTSWRIDGCHRLGADLNPEALATVEETCPPDVTTIAVWHHPLDQCETGTDDICEHLRATGAVFGLHGHIHEDNENLLGGVVNKSVLSLGTGSLHAPGPALPEGTPQSYQLLEYDPDRSSLVVHKRKKKPLDHIWQDHPVWKIGDELWTARREFQIT